MKISSQLLLIAGALSHAPLAGAHSLGQSVAVYSDNQGLTRRNFETSMTADVRPELSRLTSGLLSLKLSRDIAKDAVALSEDDYYRTHYGEEGVVTQNAALGFQASIARLTELSLAGSVAADQATSSQTLSIGAGQWLFHESLLASVELAQATLKRPELELLGPNSDLIVPPQRRSKLGATLRLKHLATPTTIVQYTATQARSNDRPDLSAYGVGLRQYLRPVNAAWHASVTRVFNRGEVDFRTDYGPIDATIVETALLKELSAATSARIGYRWFREDETQKVTGTEVTRGSDTLSLKVAHRVARWTLELGQAYYLTNEIYQTSEKRRGTMFEGGVRAIL